MCSYFLGWFLITAACWVLMLSSAPCECSYPCWTISVHSSDWLVRPGTLPSSFFLLEIWVPVSIGIFDLKNVCHLLQADHSTSLLANFPSWFPLCVQVSFGSQDVWWKMPFLRSLHSAVTTLLQNQHMNTYFNFLSRTSNLFLFFLIKNETEIHHLLVLVNTELTCQ